MSIRYQFSIFFKSILKKAKMKTYKDLNKFLGFTRILLCKMYKYELKYWNMHIYFSFLICCTFKATEKFACDKKMYKILKVLMHYNIYEFKKNSGI